MHYQVSMFPSFLIGYFVAMCQRFFIPGVREMKDEEYNANIKYLKYYSPSGTKNDRLRMRSNMKFLVEVTFLTILV